MKAPQRPPRTSIALDPAIETSLRDLLERGETLSQTEVRHLQNLIWDSPANTNAGQVALYDLAYDLEYFVADPRMRSEDPSYFGPSKAAQLASATLAEIEALIAEEFLASAATVYDAMQADPGRGIPAKDVLDAIRARHLSRSKRE